MKVIFYSVEVNVYKSHWIIKWSHTELNTGLLINIQVVLSFFLILNFNNFNPKLKIIMQTHKHAIRVKSVLIAFILTQYFIMDDLSIFNINCQESPQTIRLSIGRNV